MKTNRLLFLILIVFLMSCEKNNNESLSRWTELKNINGNSYIYQTTFVSWTGFGSITELKIEEGIVTSRVYQEFNTNETNGQYFKNKSYNCISLW
jgi:hypothetical protein